MEPTSAAKAMRAARDDPRTAAQVARRSLEHELAGDPRLAAALPTSALSGLEHYVRLLLAANDRLNLTRILEP
jgi:hypothetical protein